MAIAPIMNTYNRLPVAFERGEGSWLFDSEGKAYLDALTGIAVCGLGHAHPAVTQAISQQAANLLHTSNLYAIPNQQALAEALTRISGMDNVFFSNSGAEANEAAIKLARRYGHEKGIELPTVITFTGSFHGRTLATLTATGNPAVKTGFEPLPQGFIHLAYNDVEAVRQAAEQNPNIVAILVEPVQGEGGVIIPADDYLNQLRAICDEYDWLLMLDEVQTGNGRTGSYFAYQQNNILPDVVTTAKGLGNGAPIGACLARGKASEILIPGTHGSTYGGNPLACAAALATVSTIEDENLSGNAAEMGAYLNAGFSAALAELNGITEIRNKGLMVAIALEEAAPQLAPQALEAGLLLNITGGGKVIRLLPALNLSKDDADLLIEKLSALVKALLNREGHSTSA